ncbi:YfiR family protein [Methylophilus methylotrophus]|jgi:hypothetical protein|uniref:YfiR family protein n=1 Tax=Methylophilus methylotrophus TaxID=17 RepID=UPI000F5A27B7|nr:YfiR family protein [Methylophilus methylotrophus]
MALKRLPTLIACIACCCQSGPLQAAIPELDMKSAYLYNFAKLTDWPVNNFPTFNICTLEKVADSVNPAILLNKTINGKRVRLSRITEPASAADCQIVYLNSLDTETVSKMAKTLNTEPVLTVGDEVNGTGPGIINLSVKNNRLVFSLDLAKARKANISISSKLIPLAQKVHEQ